MVFFGLCSVYFASDYMFYSFYLSVELFLSDGNALTFFLLILVICLHLNPYFCYICALLHVNMFCKLIWRLV